MEDITRIQNTTVKALIPHSFSHPFHSKLQAPSGRPLPTPPTGVPPPTPFFTVDILFGVPPATPSALKESLMVETRVHEDVFKLEDDCSFLVLKRVRLSIKEIQNRFMRNSVFRNSIPHHYCLVQSNNGLTGPGDVFCWHQLCLLIQLATINHVGYLLLLVKLLILVWVAADVDYLSHCASICLMLTSGLNKRVLVFVGS
ncbi:hypothetical protein Tco_0804008 [Tanacetum coccineum]|uniref:Uncharacterized protein n=1 Tax=Tanacetum coccineum TaxID=301880 RepID=A0ABQ5A421_9ASTR